MPVPNSYPEKPVVPFKRTSVKMADVIQYIASLHIPYELKRAVYIFFRNESQNGEKGINHNYAGLQCDSNRWPAQYDSLIAGTVVVKENQTGRERRFLAFRDHRATLDILIGRLQARGIFVGGYAHKIAKMQVKTPDDLARVYQKEWVKGSQHAEPTPSEKANFLSMYEQAKKFFPAI